MDVTSKYKTLSRKKPKRMVIFQGFYFSVRYQKRKAAVKVLQYCSNGGRLGIGNCSYNIEDTEHEEEATCSV